jgi:uncharacterized protein
VTNIGNGQGRRDPAAEYGFWRDHTHITLTPVAAPSILGLFGFAASTFVVAANLAGWYGNATTSPLILFPFTLAFGGIAQLLAAMWAFKARDGLATGIHGAWGSFWIGYGIYNLLIAVHVLPASSTNPTAMTTFGFWFAVLAAITWVGMLAAFAENLGIAMVLLTLASGSTLLAIGMIVPVPVVVTIGAIVLVASACIAFYTASALMLRSTYQRTVLPVGEIARARVRSVPRHLIEYADEGEPGIKVGQ